MWKRNRGMWLATVFFVLCAGMTLFYLTAGYGAYLDSDMASELVLAEHLADKMSPVSREWYYSTEVRLLNTQLVFAPLMAIQGISWRLVRTLGCAILLAILAAACVYAALALGAAKAYALFFAGLSVSLCSPLYAQNVIVGAYYVPHAVLSMILIGAFAGWRRKGGCARAALTAAIAFVMGVSSIRYLLSAVLPLACAAIWMYMFPENGAQARTGRQRMTAALAAAVAAFGAAGYALGKRILPACFHINPDYYASTTYANWEANDLFEQMQAITHGLLKTLGFDGGGTPLFGAQGILNALALLMLVVSSIVLLEWKPVQKRACEEAVRETVCFGRLTLVFAFWISAAVFVLLRSVYVDRYWLPVVMLGAPVMAACLTGVRDRVFRNAVLLLFAVTMLLTSASCAYYSLRNPQVRSELRMEAVEKADELGLEKGYATFWNANILTELTDGRIEVVSLKKRVDDAGEGTLGFYRWLEAEDEFEMDMPEEPVFLLLGNWEDDGLSGFLVRAGAEQHEIQGDIQFYVIPSQKRFFDAMNGGD